MVSVATTIQPVTEAQREAGLRHPEWKDVYAGLTPEEVTSLPWYAATLDQDVERALAAHAKAGAKVLDVGCGSGEQAVATAGLGFDVTGIDVSPAAISLARSQAGATGPQFEVGNILRYQRRRGFAVVIDRGCLHVLSAEDRRRYVDRVAALMELGGILVVKCFKAQGSDPGIGPWRFAWPELRDLFQTRFTWLELSDCKFTGPRAATPAAWLCILRRSK